MIVGHVIETVVMMFVVVAVAVIVVATIIVIIIVAVVVVVGEVCGWAGHDNRLRVGHSQAFPAIAFG